MTSRLLSETPYRGRFAPSPSGPLHFGSLVAAVGSFLEARSHGGEWLLRIDDLDPPRVAAGASDAIMRTLEAFGLYWDGAVEYQSRREAAYCAALQVLRQQGAVYPCACTRREIADSSVGRSAAAVYPGTCRAGAPETKTPRAMRVRTDGRVIEFHDRLQGLIRQYLDLEVGDFVVRRSDGLFAYQLAVVVDDAERGITNVVRGADLLDSTARQIHLQQLLGFALPAYMHLPVVLNACGEKLSKQTLAPPVDSMRPQIALTQALSFLNQQPPAALADASLESVWQWALANWNAGTIPRKRGLMANG